MTTLQLQRASILLTAVMLLGLAWPAHAGDQPGMEKGKIPELAEPLSDLIHLNIENKGLRVDRQHWETVDKDKKDDDAKAGKIAAGGVVVAGGGAVAIAPRFGNPKVRVLWEKLRAAAGATSTSMSSSVGGLRLGFSGRGVTAAMTTSSTLVELTIREEEAPGRYVEVRDDGNGAFRMMVISADSGLALMYRQDQDGKVKVMDVRGDKIFRASGDTFMDFMAANEAYVEKQLFPLLKHLGFGLPMTQYSPTIKQAVLQQLRGPMTDDEKDKVKQLIADLSGKEFAKREAAMKKLSEGFVRYHTFIHEALKLPKLDGEAKERLEKIVKDNAESGKVADFITTMKLTQNAPYLVKLLKDASAEDRPVIVKALQGATGKTIGDDPAAWEKAVLTSPASMPASGPSIG